MVSSLQVVTALRSSMVERHRGLKCMSACACSFELLMRPFIAGCQRVLVCIYVADVLAAGAFAGQCMFMLMLKTSLSDASYLHSS